MPRQTYNYINTDRATFKHHLRNTGIVRETCKHLVRYLGTEGGRQDTDIHSATLAQSERDKNTYKHTVRHTNKQRKTQRQASTRSDIQTRRDRDKHTVRHKNTQI